VLSIAPLIARAIREVFEDGSVTSLFNGQAWFSEPVCSRKFVDLRRLRIPRYGIGWRLLDLVG